MIFGNWKPSSAAVLLAIPFLSQCGQQQQAAPPPPAEVAVVMIEPERVVLTTELPGRTSAFLVAEIRPQVNGLIQKRCFVEGSDVKKDDVLYEIDPAPFQAAYDSGLANVAAAKKAADQARAALEVSTAALARHEATLALANTNLERYQSMLERQATSAMQRDQAKTDVDVAQATLKGAEAQVASDKEAVGAAEAAIQQAEAALETARINLGYTKITAPFSGRIGRSTVTEGAIVTAYQAAPLATIQQLDPIYVDVPQSTVELNRLKRNLAGGRLKDSGTDEVKIVQEDGTEYPLKGSLKFRDVTVDPTTGSVILRIIVPNPDSELLPGMFVRAVIDEGVNEQAMLVPQQAVSRDPKGNPFVYLVDAKSKVEQRSITTERALGDRWLVSAGVTAGDRVILEGMQRVRPGAEVKAVPQGAEAGTAKPAGTDQATAKSN